MNRFLPFGIIWLFVLTTTFSLNAQSAMNPLPDCPKSPNCFASKLDAKKWHKKPLPFSGSLENNIELLLSLLDEIPGATHESSDQSQIHYTFQTKIGKFTDDVHFSIDAENKCFHFRSASRKGYSDMGANKRRMKIIQRLWEDKNS